jgi:hypothetical protein
MKDWHTRVSSKEKPKDLAETPFLDDQPGCYFAVGAITLVDSYNGPAIRVRKIDN